jgi:hypothetical protein
LKEGNLLEDFNVGYNVVMVERDVIVEGTECLQNRVALVFYEIVSGTKQFFGCFSFKKSVKGNEVKNFIRNLRFQKSTFLCELGKNEELSDADNSFYSGQLFLIVCYNLFLPLFIYLFYFIYLFIYLFILFKLLLLRESYYLFLFYIKGDGKGEGEKESVEGRREERKEWGRKRIREESKKTEDEEKDGGEERKIKLDAEEEARKKHYEIEEVSEEERKTFLQSHFCCFCGGVSIKVCGDDCTGKCVMFVEVSKEMVKDLKSAAEERNNSWLLLTPSYMGCGKCRKLFSSNGDILKHVCWCDGDEASCNHTGLLLTLVTAGDMRLMEDWNGSNSRSELEELLDGKVGKRRVIFSKKKFHLCAECLCVVEGKENNDLDGENEERREELVRIADRERNLLKIGDINTDEIKSKIMMKLQIFYEKNFSNSMYVNHRHWPKEPSQRLAVDFSSPTSSKNGRKGIDLKIPRAVFRESGLPNTLFFFSF